MHIVSMLTTNFYKLGQLSQ